MKSTYALKGSGVPKKCKKAYESVQGEGGLFKEGTYSHVILIRWLPAKHPK